MNLIPWDAVIGVLGTLLGALLGWNLEKCGRIIVYVKDIDVNFFKAHPPQDYLKPSESQWPDGVTVKFKVNIFNRKGIPCNFSDCKVVLKYKNEKVIIDDDPFQNEEHWVFDKMYNLDGFTCIEDYYNKSYTFLPHPEKLKSGYKIYIQYKLNGGKLIHKKLICKS